MKEDKTNPKYLRDPKLHMRDLLRFRDRISEEILGEDDAEYRGYLEFVRERTNQKIREIRTKMAPRPVL